MPLAKPLKNQPDGLFLEKEINFFEQICPSATKIVWYKYNPFLEPKSYLWEK